MITPEEPTQEQIKEFNPERDNPCWKCKYRKSGEPDYINICLQDKRDTCIQEVNHAG